MWNSHFLRFTLILLWCATGGLLAQHVPSKERADESLRRKTDIDGNNVRATTFNTGLTGRTGGTATDEIAYEWPKNSDHEHVALTAVWVGAEFPDIMDLDGDPLRILDAIQYRESPDGESWNFEPVPGYNNASYLEELDVDGVPTGNKKVGIAKSTDPNSWPSGGWADKFEDDNDPGWIGSWNGFFGKNVFNADQELFYKMGDDLYDRKLGIFQPDSTDLTRGGLGILGEVRIMSWSQILINDVVFVITNYQNDGTTDIGKMSFTIWLADVIGNNTQNDRMNYDLLNDLATMDDDEQGWGSVGVAFLETPGNNEDRIDNDGDGEVGPIVTESMLVGEIRGNYIDDNGNGLIDEDTTHIAFSSSSGTAEGVTYADRIDNDGNGEANSPLITSTMISQASIDVWKRWPPNPAGDPLQNGEIHLLLVEEDDEGFAFKDFIDNDGNGEDSSNVVTQAMIDEAAGDFYRRYKVPGTNIILYDLGQEDLGHIYADGIDNDHDGAIDEGIDEGIDEMVDESRDDGVDNDGDWDPVTDDVGLDGVADTGDRGEGDGIPTSGSGTPFPGEPNVDKTDVSESDQLGITNVQRFPAGSLNFSAQPDRYFWLEYMVPGEFWRLAPGQLEEGENDLTAASSFFPMDAGNTERFSYAVILGEDPEDVLSNREKAQETYNADYQFAKAPAVPILRGVPGDKQVTLYWDSEAEMSYDNFLFKLGFPGFDFEGYRLYRSQDPAFQDIFTITDGQGVRTFLKPIAQWDVRDGWSGYSDVDINGIKFYLGANTGLKHSYVDTDVENGITYYYALTSYDFGAPPFNIAPSESPILVVVNELGEARLGKNVVKVTPDAPVAGYQPAEVTDLTRISGTASGEINFDIVDPRLIQDGHTYQITFTDTLIPGATQTAKDTLTTKAFTLVDVTNPASVDTLIKDDTAPVSKLEAPLVDGIRLSFVNPRLVQVNTSESNQSRLDMHAVNFRVFKEGVTVGVQKPSDYLVEFGEPGFANSTEFVWRRTNTQSITFPAKPINFRVKDKGTDEYINVGFMEAVGLGTPNEGIFDATPVQTDIIVFLEEDDNGEQQITWSMKYQTGSVINDSTKSFPAAGDFFDYVLDKPFLSADVWEFTTKGESVDQAQAKADLDRIKVVPNPYLAASRFETRNPFTRGRGPRRIHFNHLPKECTIRIFTVSGELVDVIEHNSSLDDGSAEWDLLTKDNLDVSYGVYIYHIQAPGVGEKVGKFAIIK